MNDIHTQRSPKASFPSLTFYLAKQKNVMVSLLRSLQKVQFCALKVMCLEAAPWQCLTVNVELTNILNFVQLIGNMHARSFGEQVNYDTIMS